MREHDESEVVELLEEILERMDMSQIEVDALTAEVAGIQASEDAETVQLADAVAAIEAELEALRLGNLGANIKPLQDAVAALKASIAAGQKSADAVSALGPPPPPPPPPPPVV